MPQAKLDELELLNRIYIALATHMSYEQADIPHTPHTLRRWQQCVREVERIRQQGYQIDLPQL